MADADRPPAHPARSLDLDPVADVLGLALRLAQLRVFEAFFVAFEDVGLRPGEMIALFIIDRNPRIRQGVLATALAIKRSNMVKLVAGLQGRGLLDRHAATSDKRSVELTLTAAGRTLVAAALPRFRAHDKELTQGILTPVERAELIRLLHKMYAPVENGGSAAP